MVKRQNIFNLLYPKYPLEEKEFKKLKLTPNEYYTAQELLKQVHTNGMAMTFMENLAELFQRYGYCVRKADGNIYWVITYETREK